MQWVHPHRGMEVEMIALRAWKLEGHPQVGWWVKVGDDTLDFEGGYILKTDWYPHSLDDKGQGLLVPETATRWWQRAVP